MQKYVSLLTIVYKLKSIFRPENEKTKIQNKKAAKYFFKLIETNFKKPLDKSHKLCYNMRARNGRLAQLGEHLPYKQRVTGSSPVLSTKRIFGTVDSAGIAPSRPILKAERLQIGMAW